MLLFLFPRGRLVSRRTLALAQSDARAHALGTAAVEDRLWKVTHAQIPPFFVSRNYSPFIVSGEDGSCITLSDVIAPLRRRERLRLLDALRR